MTRKLGAVECAALRSANPAGQIKIPAGAASEIEDFLYMMLQLQKAGLVTRQDGKGFYGPFQLTEAGKTIAFKKDA